MSLRRHLWIDGKQFPFERDPLVDLPLGNLFDAPRHGADRIIDEFRPKFSVDRHVVRHHVAHAGKLADDADAHAPHLAHGLRRRAEIRNKRVELAIEPAARIVSAGNPRAQKRVCVVLRAVDTLVDRQLQLLKIVADRFVRLNQRERERQAVFLHRADEVLSLRIAAQQNQDAVESFAVILRREPLDIRTVERK